MRRPALTRTTTTVIAAAVAVVAVAALTPVGAEAARMITGKDIKNNSITGSDVKNGSLLASDFKPGQLVAGAPGPAGSTGSTGPKGDPGESAPKPTVAKWTFSGGGTGQPERLTGTSTMTVPAFSRVNGVNLDVSGDWSACNDGGAVTVFVTGSSGGLAVRAVDDDGGTGGLQNLALDNANVGPEPLKLAWIAYCYASTQPDSNGYVPVPSFTADLTFDYAPVNSVPTRSFQ